MTKKTFTILKAIRVHQWTKNLLIFIPLIMAHRLASADPLLRTGLAFLSFSLCASAAYLLNDLLDRERDREHPRKKHRPIASGQVSPRLAWVLFFLLLCLSLVVAHFCPGRFLLILEAYFLLSVSYSLFLKKVMLVDVLALSALYTIRIFAGSLAVNIPVSSWLLSFSIFLFLSLALLKRYSELQILSAQQNLVTGRGYRKEDLDQLSHLGTASGYLAVLVLALFINNQEIRILYAHPELLWFSCPVFLYWISRIWLLAHRGVVHEDPILFAICDRTSYIVGVLAAAIVWVAS